MIHKPTLHYLDTLKLLQTKINANHGFVNAHAHLDRAYTVTSNNFHLGIESLNEKWILNDQLKRDSTPSLIYDRMAYGVEHMLSQKVQAIGTFIDVDPLIKDKAIKAAIKIKERYKKDIKIKFINQVLKGVLEKEAYKWFAIGAEFADIIGGLPGKDKGKEAEHIDVLLDTAKKKKKMVHVHVDQLNTPLEKETELLAKKTIEYGMEGRVVAVHGVSIASHPLKYRMELYRLMKKANLMLVSCPIGWIDHVRREDLVPSHNSIAPVEEMVQEKLVVALGTDNIFDIYKPFSDGNMLTELRVLLESCHFYNIEELVKIATVNGLRVLGLS